jgi:CHAD domain-containing protein
MAFRLTHQKPLAKELARIVAKEFERTLSLVAADSAHRVEGIHEVRKSIKKIRAVVRLVRKDLGRAARVQNRQLRAIAHQLSPLPESVVQRVHRRMRRDEGWP